MKCYTCGADISENVNFCNHCGSKIEKINCPGCGETVDKLSRFCPNCGAKLKETEEEVFENAEEHYEPAKAELANSDSAKTVPANAGSAAAEHANADHKQADTSHAGTSFAKKDMNAGNAGNAGAKFGKEAFADRLASMKEWLGNGLGSKIKESMDNMDFSNIYVLDFLVRMTRKSNIPVLIYLVINLFIIALAFSVAGYTGGKAYAYAILLYTGSLVIALSPLGEWILRMQTGCHAISDGETLNFIKPLFDEVYEKARLEDSTIPENVRLFLNEEEEPNAFATGRKTICITKGMLDMPGEYIKATLGHEFGHLAHKDTDLILVVSVGNMIVTGIILLLRLFAGIAHFIMDIGAVVLTDTWAGELLMTLMNLLIRLLADILIAGFSWAWSKLGMLLVMKSSRDNELEADEFSFRLGYGNELCRFLDEYCGSGMGKGLFANLASSHPDKESRISNLQKLGAAYKRNYTGQESS